MWTILPHPEGPMGGFSWKPSEARRWIYTNFSLWFKLQLSKKRRLLFSLFFFWPSGLRHLSTCLSVCLPPLPLYAFFFLPVDVWPCSCPPRGGGGGTLGPPQPTSTVGQGSHEWERTEKKTPQLLHEWGHWVSLRWVKTNQEAIMLAIWGCCIIKQHLATSRQTALRNPTEKKK